MLTSTVKFLPPTSELFTSRQLSERHPHILNYHRVSWALRKREANGLTKSHAVFESPCGTLLVHEPTFLAWFVGLSNRAKPRRLRTKSRTPL
jgi:hypothetical protein